jgi:Pentapeptide repeats (8 copies)
VAKPEAAEILSFAELACASLSGADLTKANLYGADLHAANLYGADLSGATLTGSQLIGTDLRNATLTGSFVYGVSVWDIKVDGDTKQHNLIVTQSPEPSITVDNIKVAQFIYLILNNKEIRDIIDTITSKVVLILGRFSQERKRILDAIRDELRKREYVPIVFDFEPSINQTTVETIKTLASMAGWWRAQIRLLPRAG